MADLSLLDHTDPKYSEDEKKEILIAKIIKAKAIKHEIKARELCSDLYTFNKEVLHVEEGVGNVPLAQFHQELCEFVMDTKTDKKLILVPRGHLKSTIVTAGYSLMRIAQDPSVRILIANATYDMACSFIGQIKKQLQNNETFRDYYGDLSTNADRWSENMISVPKRKPFAKKEATVTAFGMGGNLVSQHYDVIIMDDVVNRDYINTQEQIEKTILFYKDALDLLEPGGKLIVIGTRWHDADLYGWIMDKTNSEQVYRNFEVFIRQAYQGDLETGEGLEFLYPQKFTKEILETLKREKGPYEFSCTPAETPILMGDWTTKPISEVKEGDEVIGWTKGTPTNRSQLKRQKVVRTFHKLGKVVEMKMESGRIVRCTPDHPWYTGKDDKTHKYYLPAKVGRKLMFMCPVEKYKVTRDEEKHWFYLAGIFDGEGSAKSGGCLTITQGIVNNLETYNKIKETLKALNLEHSEYVRKHENENWEDSSMIWLKDNFETSLKLIRITDLAKKNQIADKMLSHGKRMVREEDRVISIDELGYMETYALETETGNYVAWGYGSSNTQYMNEAVPLERAEFKPNWMKQCLEDELHNREMNYFTMVDPAISQKKSADKTAIVTIGVDQYNNWFVVNIIWDHMLPNQLMDYIFSNWEQWKPKKIGVEMVAYQKSLQYALVDEMRRRNVFLPIVELKAERSKEERIRGLIPRYANGAMYHLTQCPHRQSMEDELVRFPKGRHDDIIDALAYGQQIAHQARKPHVEGRRRHGRSQYLY